MKLTTKQIDAIVLGAVRTEETSDGVALYRFTSRQDTLYKERSEDFHKKSHASAGMKLRFQTDSSNLFLKVRVATGSSRKYFSFDISVNGKMIGHLDNYSQTELPLDYTTVPLSLGEFSQSFLLEEGTKEVCIYLPWSVSTEILELSLDDNSSVIPVKPAKKVLAFGDSITQGYDALRPSNRYMSKLCDALEAEEINKAIGAEIFYPELAQTLEPFSPDYITVAYGTNDWSKTSESEFQNNCLHFYAALSKNYPDAKIFAITPIWRKDHDDYRPFGTFEHAVETIRNIAAGFENVVCITGYDFVPHSEDYFADLRLHPNDAGFEHYSKNLYEQISKYI